MANESGQPLIDKNSSGKDRKWRERKIKNIDLAEIMEEIGISENKALRVMNCAETLIFMKDLQNADQLHLKQAFFCKNKLCPICSWRKSLLNAHQLAEVIAVASDMHPTARLLMLTLTLKNCDGASIKQSLNTLNEGWRKMLKYKAIKNVVIGYFKSLEITYNAKSDSFHPHLHILLMVKASYFGNNYINQPKWAELWQRATGVTYTPIIDIRTAYTKDKNGKKQKITNLKTQNPRQTINEVTKYISKPLGAYKPDELDRNTKLKTVYALLVGLKRKKHIAYGLLFRDIHNQLHKEDADCDLIVIDDDNDGDGKNALEIVARWNWARYNYYID